MAAITVESHFPPFLTKYTVELECDSIYGAFRISPERYGKYYCN